MFQTILVQPIYNAFIALVGFMPHGDAGLAIIAMTLLMRIILYPVFMSSIRTQMGMTAMQAELERNRSKYEHDKEAFGKYQLELARKYKVNPIAMLVTIVVQFGLIIALYYALFREGFPAVNQALLYSFVHVPAAVSTNFFGLMDLLTPNHLILAALVGATQYLAIRLTLKRTPPTGVGDKAATQRAQQQMMKFFMPALMLVFSYFFAGAVGLYFLVGNLVSLAQELIVRRQVFKLDDLG
jgi:YidC/Oxa1 family membrane protein insertase